MQGRAGWGGGAQGSITAEEVKRHSQGLRRWPEDWVNDTDQDETILKLRKDEGTKQQMEMWKTIPPTVMRN
jgi:hypothetical protein